MGFSFYHLGLWFWTINLIEDLFLVKSNTNYEVRYCSRPPAGLDWYSGLKLAGEALPAGA